MKDTTCHWQHFNPVSVLAGPGALSDLPRLLPATGPILLVTSAGSTRRGLTSRVRAMLDGEGLERLHVFDAVKPNPDLDELEEAAFSVRSLAPAAVLAIGGGSALDAGKVLASILGAEESRPLHRAFREGKSVSWNTGIPVVAVPTTAGTGSEVTPFATVWDRRTARKYSLVGEHVFPTACLLDPVLTLDLNAEQTLYPALDAISHALESLWNRNSTPVTEALAERALRIASRSLPAVLADGSNLAARCGMQQASFLAGQAIACTRTALAHSISYPLTLHHGVPHGLACSFTLPALLRAHAEELGADDPDRLGLLSSVEALLRSLRLHEHIARFASAHQVMTLLPQMYAPERAGNFCYKADVESIIRASLAPREA